MRIKNRVFKAVKANTKGDLVIVIVGINLYSQTMFF